MNKVFIEDWSSSLLTSTIYQFSGIQSSKTESQFSFVNRLPYISDLRLFIASCGDCLRDRILRQKACVLHRFFQNSLLVKDCRPLCLSFIFNAVEINDLRKHTGYSGEKFHVLQKHRTKSCAKTGEKILCQTSAQR